LPKCSAPFHRSVCQHYSSLEKEGYLVDSSFHFSADLQLSRSFVIFHFAIDSGTFDIALPSASKSAAVSSSFQV
jgi:hypothetical protein